MGDLQRVTRKYNVVSEKMVKHVVACIKKVPKSQLHLFLDRYEINAIANPSRWVRQAPFPEIMTIMEKMGYMNVWQMMDERNPFKCAELEAGTKELYRRGKLEKLIEGHKKHSYFCLSGREIIKHQYHFSMLVEGTAFKESSDTKYFIKSLRNHNIRNQKGVDEFIANIYETSQISELDFDDWKILWLIRRWEDLPVKALAIQGRLGDTMTNPDIQRHLNKLSKHGYLNKWGVKKATSYSLTSFGWKVLMEAKQKFFQGIRFFDNGLNFEILNENGSGTTEKRREDSDTKGINSTM